MLKHSGSLTDRNNLRLLDLRIKKHFLRFWFDRAAIAGVSTSSAENIYGTIFKSLGQCKPFIHLGVKTQGRSLKISIFFLHSDFVATLILFFNHFFRLLNFACLHQIICLAAECLNILMKAAWLVHFVCPFNLCVYIN